MLKKLQTRDRNDTAFIRVLGGIFSRVENSCSQLPNYHNVSQREFLLRYLNKRKS